MKKNVFRLAVSALIMFALPWLTVTLIRSDAAMAVCFILFFAVDPVWSVVLGVLSGNEFRSSWYLPLLSALFFLAGTWTFFDRGEAAFLLYALIYLALGAAAMLLTAAFAKKR